MPSDAEEVAEMLDAVAGRVPALLRGLIDQLYSPEAGQRMGRAIGTFYQELVSAGLPPERALELASGYASPFSLLSTVLQGQSVSWASSDGARPSPRKTAAPAGPARLEELFDNAGTSDDNAPDGADLDGWGWSLSAQALAAAGVLPGGTVTVGDLAFRWPAAAPGKPNNVRAAGQTLTIPGRPGAGRLGILGLATNGPSAGLATLRYVGGRTQPAALSFPDWTLNGGKAALPPETLVATRLPRRNGRGGDRAEALVFASILPLAAGETLEALTLPAHTDQGALHVFGLALGD